MQELLQVQLSEMGVKIGHFQILHVVVPHQYEEKIAQTQVAKQLVIQKQFEQQVAMVYAQMGVISAQADARIVEINATATSNAFFIVQQAQATATRNNIDIQAICYNLLSEWLGLTGSTLSNYIYNEMLKHKHISAKMIVGLDQSSKSAVINVGN